MVELATERALREGLLRFAPPGQNFPGRHGNTKRYLIDTRGAGTNVALRTIIVNRLHTRINAIRRSAEVDVIAGVAKSGTVWAAWLAWKLRLPFAGILPEGPRKSGLQRQVEGCVQSKRVVIVDNWTRTNSSLFSARDAVASAQGVPVALMTVVAHQVVQSSPPLFTAWTLSELLEAAVDLGLAESDLLDEEFS